MLIISALTLTLECLTPVTPKTVGNQQKQQHSYKNLGASDDYESLDMEKIGSSTYERLQLNSKDIIYYNEKIVFNAENNDKENNRYVKEHSSEGIIIILLQLIS